MVPAWLRITEGEPRWQVTVAVIASIAAELTLPNRQVLGPRWFLPFVAAVLLVALIVANPRKISRVSPLLRAGSLILISVISIGNAYAAANLIDGLVRGTESESAARLLVNGATIWATNVLAFSLWYWELDRGGPAKRAQAVKVYPDFVFTQMTSPELCPPDWEPRFADYFYMSFTNATAFSPTDVLPLSVWAKMTMMIQSAISLATVALVIARAVNILK